MEGRCMNGEVSRDVIVDVNEGIKCLNNGCERRWGWE